MRLKTYLESEVKQGFLTEKVAKCIIYKACRELGLKEMDAYKLHIISGVIFVQHGDESIEFGDLLYKCGGRAGD